jgi:inner membrane protein
MLRPSSATTAEFESLLSNGSYDAVLPEKIWTDNLQLITKNSFHEITLPVDPLTHALASYTLKRAAFPRLTRPVTIAMLIAGTVADIDSLSKFAGPSTFLTFYRTYCHSLPAALLFSLLVTFPFLLRRSAPTEKQISPLPIFIAALAASVLHLLMDICQSSGVELFRPFSTRRFALDWVAHLDLWILGILLAGILLPALSGLVTEEIGAKSKGPRGKVGASLALSTIILYLVLRFVLHGNALAAMESRTYRGESPRKAAAFAESGSPFRWHGIVETESALHDFEMEVGPAASFEPDSAVTSYKPESSPALDAARDTAVARRFLQIARFPKATVEKTPEGFHVILRAFPTARDVSSAWRVHALIDTDSSGKILSQELAWDPGSSPLW